MADLSPYTRTYGFSAYQASNPAKPLPAIRLDEQLIAIAEFSVRAASAVNGLRRSDGGLQNGVVTLDSLSPDVRSGVPAAVAAAAEGYALRAEAAVPLADAKVTAASGFALAASGSAQAAADAVAAFTAAFNPEVMLTKSANLTDLTDVAAARATLGVMTTTEVNAAIAAAVADAIPVGTVIAWPIATPPTGWLPCYGNTVLRADYPELFAVIGTMFSVEGDAATTFRTPNYLDRFLRGYDGGASGRVIGSYQADAIKAHSHDGVLTSIVGGSQLQGGSNYQRTTGSTGSTGDTETRPKNVTVLFCIKY